MLPALLLLSLFQIVHCSCPEGFELVRDGKCRGKYTTVSVYWDVAQTSAVSKCKEIQGQPIIIHDEEQQSYWKSRGKAWTLIGCTHTQYTDTDIYCTTQLHPPAQSLDGCDTFEDDYEDGVCYQVTSSIETWQDAQMLCKKLGANLASIHNKQENTFIRRLAIAKGAVNGVFLGGVAWGKGNGFSWIDGTEWDYENFHPGFPKDGYGDCLAMDTSMSGGLWLNENCSVPLPVACIRDQRPVVEPTCFTGTWKERELITSPGFPFNASTFCDYFLTVEVGKQVEATIDLEANSCCDFLTIYDGELGGALLANLTGEVRSKVVKTTISNTMRVNWQPNGGVNVRGLAMTFRGVLH